MHTYLRAIGFSKLEKKAELDVLLKKAVQEYTDKQVVQVQGEKQFVEFTKEIAPDCGLRICGEYDSEGVFSEEYYFPFLTGSMISSSEEVLIERQSDKEAYIGACDDLRLEFSLIFHLINAADYLKVSGKEPEKQKNSSISFSGLSVEGKILLPVVRSADYANERQKKVQKRTAMLMAARNGDEEAMESLTEEDMDIFNTVTKRAQNEDLYSIIDNNFMPYGFGSDIYSIIADINGFEWVENSLSGETICRLNLSCNGISLDVCINEADLMGEPQVGRRFKGVIWLQGLVEFGYPG